MFRLAALHHPWLAVASGGTGEYQNARGQGTLKIVTEDRTRNTLDLIP